MLTQLTPNCVLARLAANILLRSLLSFLRVVAKNTGTFT
jgi:hypothetical protein